MTDEPSEEPTPAPEPYRYSPGAGSSKARPAANVGGLILAVVLTLLGMFVLVGFVVLALMLNSSGSNK